VDEEVTELYELLETGDMDSPRAGSFTRPKRSGAAVDQFPFAQLIDSAGGAVQIRPLDVTVERKLRATPAVRKSTLPPVGCGGSSRTTSSRGT
jgi:hypothetical protein